jgi:hypothetical protein
MIRSRCGEHDDYGGVIDRPGFAEIDRGNEFCCKQEEWGRRCAPELPGRPYFR